jgi:hypothetical protein
MGMRSINKELIFQNFLKLNFTLTPITKVDSVDEIFTNVSDALEALIEGYQDLGQPLPEILRPQVVDYPIWAETLIPVQLAA